MEQDSQRLFNVTVRCAGATTVAVEKQNDSVFVALGTQLAMHMQCILVICGLSRSTIFFAHYFIQGTISEEKNYRT